MKVFGSLADKSDGYSVLNVCDLGRASCTAVQSTLFGDRKQTQYWHSTTNMHTIYTKKVDRSIPKSQPSAARHDNGEETRAKCTLEGVGHASQPGN